ncbi:MAG: DUF2804 family protein, partial [Sphaerochaetaceae bacterium]|nr:DUF2804 family protein [Sphaerochaetaceae bacterium]
MQHEVTAAQQLLSKKGTIVEEGWARRPLWKYDRKEIKASALKIKEWDYYAVMSHEHKFCITATIADLGYAGLFNLAFIDLERGKAVQIDALKALPLGSLRLKSDSGDHSIAWKNEKLRLAFSRKGDTRRLLVASPDL